MNCGVCLSILLPCIKSPKRGEVEAASRFSCTQCGRVYIMTLEVLEETKWTEDQERNHVKATGPSLVVH